MSSTRWLGEKGFPASRSPRKMTTVMSDQIEPVPREVGLRAMLRIGSGDPWLRALRAAVAMTAPLALGVATGDTHAGMAAGLGGFTALYARDRPYLDRARALAFIAVAFAVAISVGVWTASAAWVSVLVVAVVASLVAISCLAISARHGPAPSCAWHQSARRASAPGASPGPRLRYPDANAHRAPGRLASRY